MAEKRIMSNTEKRIVRKAGKIGYEKSMDGYEKSMEDCDVMHEDCDIMAEYGNGNSDDDCFYGNGISKRYVSGVVSWIADSGEDMFPEGFYLMNRMYIEYVYYCKMYDIEPICTDRQFSKSLSKIGCPSRRSRYGTEYAIAGVLDGSVSGVICGDSKEQL